MTTSFSATASFTKTHAAHLASKIAADMRQFSRFYGRPMAENIQRYLDELTQLLAGHYVDEYKFGLRKGGNWIVCYAYKVVDGALVTDGRPGGIQAGVDASGASFYNYLSPSTAWWQLSSRERDKIRTQLPIQRTPGEEPGCGSGYWVEDRGYEAGGVGVQRKTFRAL